MSIRIDANSCFACGACREACPGNLIKRDARGKAFIMHPEECWGCASCLKECRHGAISYFLGADIGGRGSVMRTVQDGELIHWHIIRPNGETTTVTVDRSLANRY